MSFSRSRTRRFLLQSLYARVIAGVSAPKDSPFFEEVERIDDSYFKLLENAIILNEGKLFSVIYEAAPKYDVKSLPIINALILFICLTEILIICPDDVPVRVSVNEAIELAKRYSDTAGKNLINGILNTIITQKDKILETWSVRKSLEYSLFSTK